MKRRRRLVNSAGERKERERESGRTDSAHRLREISDHIMAEFGGVPVVAQGENVIKALRPLKNVYCLPCPLHSPAVLPLRTSGMKQPTIPYKQAVNAHTCRPSVRRFLSLGGGASGRHFSIVDVGGGIEEKRREETNTERAASGRRVHCLKSCACHNKGRMEL